MEVSLNLHYNLTRFHLLSVIGANSKVLLVRSVKNIAVNASRQAKNTTALSLVMNTSIAGKGRNLFDLKLPKVVHPLSIFLYRRRRHHHCWVYIYVCIMVEQFLFLRSWPLFYDSKSFYCPLSVCAIIVMFFDNFRKNRMVYLGLFFSLLLVYAFDMNVEIIFWFMENSILRFIFMHGHITYHKK